MTLKNFEALVQLSEEGETEEFDALSTTLFEISLDVIINGSNHKRPIITKDPQVCTDD